MLGVPACALPGLLRLAKALVSIFSSQLKKCNTKDHETIRREKDNEDREASRPQLPWPTRHKGLVVLALDADESEGSGA
jgi:hypothetical protein